MWLRWERTERTESTVQTVDEPFMTLAPRPNALTLTSPRRVLSVGAPYDISAVTVAQNEWTVPIGPGASHVRFSADSIEIACDEWTHMYLCDVGHTVIVSSHPPDHAATVCVPAGLTILHQEGPTLWPRRVLDAQLPDEIEWLVRGYSTVDLSPVDAWSALPDAVIILHTADPWCVRNAATLLLLMAGHEGERWVVPRHVPDRVRLCVERCALASHIQIDICEACNPTVFDMQIAIDSPRTAYRQARFEALQCTEREFYEQWLLHEVYVMIS